MSINNQTKEIQKLFSEIATESGFQKTKKAWFYSKRIDLRLKLINIYKQINNIVSEVQKKPLLIKVTALF
jgi:hypothetical protein